MSYKNFLFDLDGTLVNSAPGIEDSFYKAYLNIYKKDCPISITDFIGPPIEKILYKVNGELNNHTKKKFIDKFKKNYDSKGYLKTFLYDDVDMVLKILSKNKNLFIVTNKRKKPTKLILDYLSIGKYFKEICCPDMFEKNFLNKEDQVFSLLQRNSLQINKTIMIGDSEQDGFAAEKNELDFVLVDYGYGDYRNYKFRISKINKLINI